jgi:hypothetical protein
MDVLQVPLAAAAVLLVVSGPPKIARPDATERALRLTGLPSNRSLVRASGALELAVGIGVIVDGDRPVWPFALGVIYAAFAFFVLLAVWRRAPLSSCGCFGANGVAPTALHAGVDAGASAVGFLAAIESQRALIDVFTDGGGDAIALFIGTAVLAGAVYWLFTRWSPRT